jgi:hypothetical protein
MIGKAEVHANTLEHHPRRSIKSVNYISFVFSDNQEVAKALDRYPPLI